jgi:hypothetical protein
MIDNLVSARQFSADGVSHFSDKRFNHPAMVPHLNADVVAPG